MENIENFRFYWFEENLAQFLFKYDFPVAYVTGDIIDFIKNYQDRFLQDFDSILLNGEIQSAPVELYNCLSEQKKFIAHEFEELTLIIRAIENAQLSLAERKIDELLANIESDYLLTTINNTYRWNPELYRVRIAPKDTITDKMELFHVPYNSRSKVPNERYNIAGNPCLYLSTYLNLAWRECGCPKEFYYAQFKYKYLDSKDWREQDWKFLSLLRPREVANSELCSSIINDPQSVSDFLVRYFRTYPIIFACSIINKHKSDPYKPEYIIPQLLSQWVERNCKKVRGIIYFPCTEDNGMREYNGYNIVLPTYNYDETGYSIDLQEKFEISTVSYSSNTISDGDKNNILDLYDNLQNYISLLNPISDAILEMRRIVSRLKLIAIQSSLLSSEILIAFTESVVDNCKSFMNTPLHTIINQCRKDPEYQSRYEPSIISFTKLYNDFESVYNNIVSYHLFLERGFAQNYERILGDEQK